MLCACGGDWTSQPLVNVITWHGDIVGNNCVDRDYEVLQAIAAVTARASEVGVLKAWPPEYDIYYCIADDPQVLCPGLCHGPYHGCTTVTNPVQVFVSTQWHFGSVLGHETVVALTIAGVLRLELPEPKITNHPEYQGMVRAAEEAVYAQ